MIKKADVILLIALIIFGVVLTTLPFHMEKGKMVKVTVDGELYGEYLLNSPQDIRIEYDGHINHITIKNGFVQMSASNCKNQICVHHKKTNQTHDLICCLPNKVVVEVVSEFYKEDEIDVISGQN